MAISIGQTISHYTILEHLGGGGMGVVYKAEDTRLKRIVALKFLPPEFTRDPGAKERFVHEAQAASTLQHTNICVVYDIDETPDGQMFISMEYLQGESLETIIARGPLKVDEAVGIATQIAHGLVKATEQGIVHRDIKPANIMVTREGVAKIVDFGLAKLTGRTQLTREGSTLGTVAYMSPEQASGGQVDGRTDLWSLGVVLYEMLTGRKPFEAEYETALLYAILNARPEPVTGIRTGVSQELERIIDKAMAKDPSDRYQHPDELLVDLRHALKPGERTAPLAPPRSPQTHRPRRRWLKTAAGGVTILVLAALAMILRPLLFDDILVSEPKPVAVFTFTNQTGDHSYDYLQEAIPNLLITSLEQSRFLRVLTWERMGDILRKMGRKDVSVIDRELAFEICRSEGIHAIVFGSFVKAGETFATDVKVLDVESKEILKTAAAKGTGVQSILDDQIDDLSKEISRGIGLSGRPGSSAPAQITEVTTSSMEAYNYYLRGWQEVDKLYYEQAITFLQKAVALDSSFALAHLALSTAYSGLGLWNAQAEALRRAMRHSAKAGEKERLIIQASYARVIERNIAKQRQTLEELVSRFPDEKRFRWRLGALYRTDKRMADAHLQLDAALRLDPDFAPAVIDLAYLYADEGNYARANEYLIHYAAISPGDANPFDSMGEIAMRMGYLDRSVAYYEKAVAVKSDFWQSYLSAAYVRALQERYDETFRHLQDMKEATGQRTVKVFAEYWMAWFRAWLGQPTKALARWEQILQAETVGENKELITQGDDMLQTFINLDAGAIDRSRSRLGRSFAHMSTSAIFPVAMQVRYLSWIGIMDIQQRRLDSARARSAMMSALMPNVEHRSRHECELRLAEFNGELLLAGDSADAAIALLRTVSVSPPDAAGTAGFTLYNVPFMHDGLARAFARKGDRPSAIAEYRKLLTIDSTDSDRRLIHPRYHLRLAHLLRQTGERQLAIGEYRRFLELWRNAEKDRPELQEANDGLRALGVGP